MKGKKSFLSTKTIIISILTIVLLGVATILTIWSMIMYLKAGAKYMKEEKSE